MVEQGRGTYRGGGSTSRAWRRKSKDESSGDESGIKLHIHLLSVTPGETSRCCLFISSTDPVQGPRRSAVYKRLVYLRLVSFIATSSSLTLERIAASPTTSHDSATSTRSSYNLTHHGAPGVRALPHRRVAREPPPRRLDNLPRRLVYPRPRVPHPLTLRPRGPAKSRLLGRRIPHRLCGRGRA